MIQVFSLRKKCHDIPPFKPFNADEGSKFIGYETGIDFFTPAEKIFLIKKELDSLRARSNEKIIPGHNEAELYFGKSIMRRLYSSKLVSHVQPVHDREILDKLRANWIRGFSLLQLRFLDYCPQIIYNFDSYLHEPIFVATYKRS